MNNEHVRSCVKQGSGLLPSLPTQGWIKRDRRGSKVDISATCERLTCRLLETDGMRSTTLYSSPSQGKLALCALLCCVQIAWLCCFSRARTVEWAGWVTWRGRLTMFVLNLSELKKQPLTDWSKISSTRWGQHSKANLGLVFSLKFLQHPDSWQRLARTNVQYWG